MFLPSLASIATKNVITITVNDTINDAINIMNSKNIRDVIVTSAQNHYIITIHDIIKFQLDGVDFSQKLSNVKLQTVPEVSIKASLFEAIDSIKESIDHICLLDSKGELAGIISYSDLVSSVDTEIFAEHKNLGDILDSRHFLRVTSCMSTHDVFTLMQDGHHNCAVVYDDDKAVGILTQKDIIKLLHQNGDLSQSISSYMTSPIKSVSINMSINEALEHSRANKVKRIVVSSECGTQILGVISQKELFAIAYGRWSKFVVNQQKQLEEAVKQRTAELQTEIAQRKQTEQELQEYKLHLEELVERKSRELEEQKRHQMAQLFHQSRINAMGEMIRAVAHHWRQPLNIIAMELQDIKITYTDGRLDEQYLDEVVSQGMNTIREMSKTIDFARGIFELGGMTACCALELVKKAVSLMSADLKSCDIEVEASCFGDKPTQLANCHCDPFSTDTKLVKVYTGEFQQVIVALLSNAKDAILTKRAMSNNEFSGRIDISFDIVGELETISIKDNGGGIDEEVMLRIFDPFFTTKEIGKGEGLVTGVGLGLYFAKMVIEEKMNGKLNVTNDSNGALFTISMPYIK